ncbi:phosphoribosylamine--glycine ligase [Aureibacillus halotolerans]|uniref:Phosphoribosylamine--glycine ligase n=1 Tax=Aureibacillus halotolerans TaxID=1508390 RepID=A0A4R6TSK2_9BACI|nr:phosphoribosylamine--glycine ligase [Aureibacillus halotolerans]TDQ34153.1 phosphoribosylamine--glycine ligase [Aureibacillus halotolerans]
MNVLVIGRGGREHAICYAFSKSPRVQTVFAAPGNAGIAAHAELVSIDESDQEKLISFAKDNEIEWVFVGPEVPLMAGIVDRFQEAGIKAFGPVEKAAIIEGSKDFAKQLMASYGIPTAASKTFTDYEEAQTFVKAQGAPIVLKADGLAAGKGVIVAMTDSEAEEGLKALMLDGHVGTAGTQVVVEEFLEGEEFSLMSFVNGDYILPMPISQDHKRAFDGDKGPNTGGMGAYTPVPQIADAEVEKAIETIVKPAAKAMQKEGRSFTGILYAGLILTKEGPKVIEFNARFGDPETQVILPLLETDLVDVLEHVTAQKPLTLSWKNEAVVGVVVASEGYPGTYDKGASLPGLDKVSENALVFHAGTKAEDGEIVTDGGRVLLAAQTGNTLQEAKDKAYSALRHLKSNDVFYRTDIGDKAITAAGVSSHTRTQ